MIITKPKTKGFLCHIEDNFNIYKAAKELLGLSETQSSNQSPNKPLMMVCHLNGELVARIFTRADIDSNFFKKIPGVLKARPLADWKNKSENRAIIHTINSMGEFSYIYENYISTNDKLAFRNDGPNKIMSTGHEYYEVSLGKRKINVYIEEDGTIVIEKFVPGYSNREVFYGNSNEFIEAPSA